MPRTLRVSVREEITERSTIEVAIPDHLDIADQEALNEFLEEVWTGATDREYIEVKNTKELAINDRVFFEPEVLS